jgi:hypothetical protein
MGSVPGTVEDAGVSPTGEVGCVAAGTELGTEAVCFGQLGLGAAFLAATFFGAAFLAAALGEDFDFLGAALATFFAVLRAAPDFLAFAFSLVFAFTFEGRVFFFATLFLAAGRLAFATVRFFDLLFFAMVTLLLEIVRTLCESSPEKVCCHLRMKLESATRIA